MIVSVGCDARARTACEGALTLQTPVRGGTLVLGRGAFYIDAGGTDPVLVALNKRGRTHMARVKTLRATARAVATDGAGRPIDTRRVITLTTGASAAPTAKLASVGAATAVVRRGLASVRVSCARAADGACSGSVALRVKIGRAFTTIGTGQFLLNPGRSQFVLVALTSRGRGLLASRARLRVQTRVTARDDSGKRTVALRTIVLRR